jgi:RNA polymerase sigma-70 factor (ECF subfamily)
LQINDFPCGGNYSLIFLNPPQYGALKVSKRLKKSTGFLLTFGCVNVSMSIEGRLDKQIKKSMAQAGASTPDEILVVAAILGDLAAFDELVIRYRAAVIRTAQMIVPLDDVEDVAQEALLLAFKALPSLEEPKKFPAWLHAITRHSAIRFSQRARRHTACVALDEAILEQVPALSRPMAGDGADEELLGALDCIPRSHAIALRLHFLDEMPLKRIAGFLGVSVSTLKWRIYRGKILLRARFKALAQRREKWIEKKK